MARLNQFAGRTSDAWQARYQGREEQVLAMAEALELDYTPERQQSSGPGVAGPISYVYAVKVCETGEILTRKMLRRRCEVAGIAFDHHGRPIAERAKP